MKNGGVSSPRTPAKGDSYAVRAYTDIETEKGETWVKVLWEAPYDDEPAEWCNVKDLGIPLSPNFLKLIKSNAKKGEETSALPDETSDQLD
jgi:hypothetical protein